MTQLKEQQQLLFVSSALLTEYLSSFRKISQPQQQQKHAMLPSIKNGQGTIILHKHTCMFSILL